MSTVKMAVLEDSVPMKVRDGVGTYKHEELLNLDYEHSGHTGFASETSVNNKVEKVNTQSVAYGTDESGNQSLYSVKVQAYPNSIAMRSSGGKLIGNTENTDGEKVLVNKGYLQSLVNTLATKTELNDKVDKVAGKGLSTNDLTNQLKQKILNSEEPKSYANYETMVSELNNLSAKAILIGQSIYIVTINVPDLWVYGNNETYQAYTYTTQEDFINELATNGYVHIGYFYVAPLETSKVNLNDYLSKSEASYSYVSFVEDQISLTTGTERARARENIEAAGSEELITGLNTKQDKATTQTVTITVADWGGGTTCTKSVPGATANNIIICDSSDGSVECTAQGAGTLTFTATSTPTATVTVKVVIL